MASPADFTLSQSDGGRTAVCTGDWTAVLMGEANERLEAALKGLADVTLDLSRIGRCDTSGAYGLLKAAGMAQAPPKFVAKPEVTRLLELVDRAVKAEPTRIVERHSVLQLFDRIGRGVIHLGLEGFDTMVFFGHLLVAVGHAISNPRKVRWAACFSLAERAGLDAVPIVSITTFFIGAVVGLLGANMLTTFGAQVYVVELIGVAVLREFNVLITALLLAGRSASSFAAEIGSMKMNQEIDAMQVLGVDAFDALVFPRFFALLMTIPLLTFAATIAGLAGGLVVAWSQLGLGPVFFFQQLLDNVGEKHFWVGMSKAPVLAVVIAAIGCRQGMEVGGDVESLGRRVTSAVVQAIFATILIDAVFAIIYMKLNI
ncbi:MAG TPA: ABC transporter permease [Caulobacteraceae bacterium]|jgi:phospholipid/cholesterol/gamma-HCH transport system permease protein|nr:ABC transporter permease [Caulobacteraceae bacterium]